MNRIKNYEQLATDISAWIKDYATTNNIKSLVVGVSGGIDSAVVSTLCACTGLSTYVLSMPIAKKVDEVLLSEYLPDTHILWLCNKYSNIQGCSRNLTDVYHRFVLSVFSIHELPTMPHALANTQSRLRMVALYQIATALQGIVIGTGNKVEDFGVGFYTKYGDGGVDISPIAGLYKTEVRELAKHLGISQEIIDAAPTDGLWSDERTDEQQLGCTYEELEWAMDYLSPNTIQLSNMIMTDRRKEVLDIYRKLNKQNQHKMLPIPIYKVDKHI